MSYVAAAYAVGNVLSSVAIVLLNKRIFANGFHFPMTLTFFHFVFTFFWYKLLGFTGAYVKPPPDAMPQWEQFKVAGAIFSSIGFMNLSLNANSIGFYQVTKLTIIPVTLAINAFAYGTFASAKIIIALAILLAGVGVSTVTEVHLRLLGLLYGVIAVLTTAVCQVRQQQLHPGTSLPTAVPLPLRSLSQPPQPPQPPQPRRSSSPETTCRQSTRRLGRAWTRRLGWHRR